MSTEARDLVRVSVKKAGRWIETTIAIDVYYSDDVASIEGWPLDSTISGLPNEGRARNRQTFVVRTDTHSGHISEEAMLKSLEHLGTVFVDTLARYTQAAYLAGLQRGAVSRGEHK